ncbi:hypothetical protein [Aliivibrio sifiae]|uniref:SMODS-associating 2TM beta-strand rich effector domain-containing protein n=1 Tax=Aliivibrio sifiae TaxID=566293 RepID=A0A2S7X3E0_9GAMM|nr:hypothetical protein [Aliivibrio sifiae]PQJ84548.1 hypothetical protein BTO22_13600 [Aliivibrio sifiae]
MEDFKVVLLSVFSGVLTSVVIYWFSLTMSKIILPWYRNLMYHGVDVSGEWKGRSYLKEDVFFELSLSLEQTANDITGVYTSSKYRNGDLESTSVMKVKGALWEGFLSLNCRTVSNKRLSFGSMLLKVDSDRLRGKQLFRNLNHKGDPIVNLLIEFEPK